MGKPFVDSGDLIEIINELQNKLAVSGNSLEISLPQIVVVGCQSAGKSSVLENIVCREFLPRGSGVVTRRPTVVQLHPCEDEYAVFLHKPDEKFKDFQKVKEEISNETLRDPGPVGFSSKPISLKIYSPKVLKLTLVDLPGLIRVTVEDQSESSIKEVRNMVLEYIRQPNSLILAVSPANQDIANSDALEIAQTVDPHRVRTIGVLTKLDLMDEGTDARDVLENKKISLRRGYVGVLNRSQKDIEEGQNIEFCLRKEKQFFESMPCYRLVQNFIDKFQIGIFGYSEKVKMEELSTGAMINYKLYTSIQNSLKLPELPDEKQLLITVANLHGIRNSLFIPSLALESVMSHLLSEYIDPLNNLVDAIANVLQSDVESIEVMDSYPSLKNEVLYLIRKSIEESAFTTKESLEKHMQSEMYFVNTYYKDFVFPDLKIEAFFPMKLWNKRHQPQSYAANSENLCDGPSNNLYEKKEPYTANSENLCDGPSNDMDEREEATENLTSNKCAKENVSILLQLIKKYMVIKKKHIGDIAIRYILFFLVKNVMDFVKSGLVPTILECAENSDSIFRECENDFNQIMQIESICKSLEEALVAIHTF